jgi:2-dehydro-3-deoxyphosphogluconate aldolase/(4S)-4-hydroxy-2-oxoglutarate aldolase
MDTLSQIREYKLIAIIRGADPDDVMKIAQALYEGGIRILEITMNSVDALKLIKQLSEQFAGRMTIGAGTVLDAKTAKAAITAGARFILSPTVSKNIIKATRQLGAVSIPGAFTPTEVLKAYKAGADMVKIFPCGPVGASYIKDLMGPLKHIPMLVTGGLDLRNIYEFKKVGVAGYGIGSNLVDTTVNVTSDYLLELTALAMQYIAAIS